MHTMQVAQRMTADEFLAVPYDGTRSQLIAGEVVVTEAEFLHQIVLKRVLKKLEHWTDEALRRGLVSLPLDIKLDERNVYGPDLLWYAEDQAPALGDKRPYPMPGIVVEVRSPSTWRHDVGVKALAYERAGLAELWLVDPVEREVIVYRRSGPSVPTFDIALKVRVGGEVTSPQLPGFALDVASLFAD
jgi:Uma2 family endonuclease